MTDTITVKIEATQKIKYVQERSISKEAYDKYLAMCEDGQTDEAFDREFGHLIDPQDVCDSDELEDFYMTKVNHD